MKYLDISNLKLNSEKDTLELIKTMPKLEQLNCFNTFKTYTLKQLKFFLTDKVYIRRF